MSSQRPSQRLQHKRVHRILRGDSLVDEHIEFMYPPFFSHTVEYDKDSISTTFKCIQRPPDGHDGGQMVYLTTYTFNTAGSFDLLVKSEEEETRTFTVNVADPSK